MRRMLEIFTSLGLLLSVLTDPSQARMWDPDLVKSHPNHCLATAIYHEARGEPIEGWKAIVDVIIFRVMSNEFPNTVCGVVYDKTPSGSCEFSFACDDILDEFMEQQEYEVIYNTAVTHGISGKWAGGPITLFYHALPKDPKFFRTKLTYVRTIGNHRFFAIKRGN